MKTFLLFVFSCTLLFGDISIKEKILHHAPGEYVVYLQGKTFSLFHLKSIQDQTVLIEEIAGPEYLIKEIDDFKAWVKNKAEGHTAWTLYEIDLKEEKLLETFSYSRSAWLKVTESECFLPRLFNLSLNPIPDEKRKKTGSGKPWNPPMILEGGIVARAQFQALTTRWPKDSSELSNRKIDLYFDQGSNFVFPFWIEVSDYYTSRAIDAGKNLKSPYLAEMPRREPHFLSAVQKKNDGYFVTVSAPVYFQDFELATNEAENIDFTIVKREGETLHLQLSLEKLKKNQSYQLMLFPKKSKQHFCETNFVHH